MSDDAPRGKTDGMTAMVLGMLLLDAVRGPTKITAKQSAPREPSAAE